MGRIAVIASLLALLAGSLWFGYAAWTAEEGPPMRRHGRSLRTVHAAWTAEEGPPMPVGGYIAMGLGIFFSLAVGCGLMALVFYSHRHGYDDAAHGAKADEER